jgi:NADH dehydrogenase
VSDATEASVTTRSGTMIDTETMVWTAGVRPPDLAHQLGVEVAGGGRVEVDDHLRVPGHDGVFAIGDVAAARNRRGEPLAMQAPPAMQQGRAVARSIRAQLAGVTAPPFRYRDKGSLATIGRRAAVGQVRGLRFRGFLGWVVWLAVHLYYLIDFENRVRVLMRWAWYYVRYDRPVRAIMRAAPEPPTRE